MIHQLSQYFGQRTLFIATAVGLIIGFGTMFTFTFAHGNYANTYVMHSWDNIWNETHQAYIASEARTASRNTMSRNNSYTTSRVLAQQYPDTLSNGNYYTTSTRVVYNRDGTEVNSWDNIWNETHQAYVANETRNNRHSNTVRPYNNQYLAYDSYYDDNRYNNRTAYDAGYGRNAQYAYEYYDTNYYPDNLYNSYDSMNYSPYTSYYDSYANDYYSPSYQYDDNYNVSYDYNNTYY